jgi:hypothetical protein
MSRQLFLDTIALRPTPRLAHTEYVCHNALVEKVTGVNPDRDGLEAARRFNRAWGVDFIFGTYDGPVDWGAVGRVTDMGHAVYIEDGRDFRQPGVCPFEDVREVWDFDPVAEYGLPDFRDLVAHYQGIYDANRETWPDSYVTGGYYKTIVSGAIAAFGWDMLLQAAADRNQFAAVLERFAAYTMHYVRAWAETTAEVFIQHDDMVWTAGPFMHPDFYRRAIFPHFKAFWSALKAKGKKVLFCSDGTFDTFLDDLIACGADGFIFEPSNDFDLFVERCGRTHLIVGSKVDCRTLAFGTWDQVKAQMDATLALAPQCAGLVWAVGNHFPPNIPIEMAERYIEYLQAHWARPT